MGDTQPPASLSAVNVTDSNNGEGDTSSDDEAAANMSDNDIGAALGLEWVSKRSKSRVGDASYNIYLATKQWPWEWVGNNPPKEWTAGMVASLSLVLGRVSWGEPGSSGPECKHTVEDVKDSILGLGKRSGNGRRLKQSDIVEALRYFSPRGKKPIPAVTDKGNGPCVGSSVELEEAADQNNEEVDQEHADDSTVESKQHKRASDTNEERYKNNNEQPRKGSEAIALPVSSSNSPNRVAVPEKLAKQMNSAQLKKVKTVLPNHSLPSLLAPSKKRAHPEDTSPDPTIAAPDRPAQKRCLGRNKSTDESELVVPPLKDTAATMTKEEELATLQTVFKRREAESRREATNMIVKARVLRDKLKEQKESLKAGNIATHDSRAKLEIYQYARSETADRLHTLRQTIGHYQANKSLLETIDPETRESITKGHERRLSEMKQELDNAEARVQRGQRVVDAEVEEARKGIEKGEAELRKTEENAARAEIEEKRWLCIKSLAAMEADDLGKVMAGFEKEGQGLLERLKKRDQL